MVPATLIIANTSIVILTSTSIVKYVSKNIIGYRVYIVSSATTGVETAKVNTNISEMADTNSSVIPTPRQLQRVPHQAIHLLKLI